MKRVIFAAALFLMFTASTGTAMGFEKEMECSHSLNRWNIAVGPKQAKLSTDIGMDSFQIRYLTVNEVTAGVYTSADILRLYDFSDPGYTEVDESTDTLSGSPLKLIIHQKPCHDTFGMGTTAYSGYFIDGITVRDGCCRPRQHIE